MKKTIYGMIGIMILAFGFMGCSESDIKEALGADKEDDKTTVSTSATIRYSDNSIMGVTRAEDPVNGGFKIYHIGTAELVGFIGADGSVNDIGGRGLGVCAGATVSDNGVLGDCRVPTANPYQVPVQPTPIPQPTSQPTPCSQSFTTTPSGCEDRRDGSFDVSWNQQTCNQHGYFYCTLNNICTNQTININECLNR